MTPIPPYTVRRWQSLQGFVYKWAKILGISSLLTGYLMFMWTFMTAYSNPSKTVLVSINKVGEAKTEFYFILFLLIPTMYIVSRMLKREAQSEAC